RELRHCVTKGSEFGVCIASDAALRKANRRFLGKNDPTDVLSFPCDVDAEACLVGRPSRAAAGPLAGSPAPRNGRTKAGRGAGRGGPTKRSTRISAIY